MQSTYTKLAKIMQIEDDLSKIFPQMAFGKNVIIIKMKKIIPLLRDLIESSPVLKEFGYEVLEMSSVL